MMEAVRAVVIIPNHNGADHLVTCLDSLATQTYPDFEIVVVDNGSQDESAAVCGRYPLVRVVQLGRNEGFPAAVNAGIRSSNSEYIVLLNNDTEAAPDWLERLVAVMDAQPEFSFASSKVLRLKDRSVVDSVGHYYSLWHRAGNLGQGEPASAYVKEMPIFGACAAAAIYRRSLFDDIGLFDADFFFFYEDVDIDLRATVAGHRCLFVPSAVVYHLRSGSHDESATTPVFGIRNQLWASGRSLPSGLFALWLLTLPVRAVIWFAAPRGSSGAFSGGSSIANARARPAWTAVAEAVKTLASKRTDARAVRRLGSMQLLRVIWATRASRVRRRVA